MPKFTVSFPLTIIPVSGGFPSSQVATFEVEADTAAQAAAYFVDKLAAVNYHDHRVCGLKAVHPKSLDLTPLKCPTCKNVWGVVPLSGCRDDFHSPRDAEDPEEARPLPALVTSIEDGVRSRFDGGVTVRRGEPALPDGWWHVDFVFNGRAVNVEIEDADRISVSLIHPEGDSTTDYLQPQEGRSLAGEAIERVFALLTQESV